MAYTDKGNYIRAAAKAQSDLHIFAAVVALMESSLISSDCDAAGRQIVKICKVQQAKCLARYDRAILKAGGGTYA